MFVILCWSVWSEICKISREGSGQIQKINVDWAHAFIDNIRKYSTVCFADGYVVHQLQNNRGILHPQTISDWTWMHDLTARGTDLVLG